MSCSVHHATNPKCLGKRNLVTIQDVIHIRFRKIVLAILLLGALLLIAAGTYLAETTLHVPKKVVTQNNIKRAEAMAGKYQYDLLNTEVPSDDAVLRAWYFKKSENRKAVILLHGQGDNRAGMSEGI